MILFQAYFFDDRAIIYTCFACRAMPMREHSAARGADMPPRFCRTSPSAADMGALKTLPAAHYAPRAFLPKSSPAAPANA